MASYTLHLGFRWGGPQIGSILGTGPALPHDARFLQFALANASGAAAWFQFQPQDTMQVAIWDLSSTSAPDPTHLVLGLSMSFGPLDGASDQYTTIDPSTLVAGGATQTVDLSGKTSTLLAFDSIVPVSSSGCPWGGSRKCYSAGAVTLTASASYEIGFIVTASYQGTSQVFVADPEVIVGSGGARPPSSH